MAREGTLVKSTRDGIRRYVSQLAFCARCADVDYREHMMRQDGLWICKDCWDRPDVRLRSKRR